MSALAERIAVARRALHQAHHATGLLQAPTESLTRSHLACVSTGISTLDESLGGGLMAGALYGLEGERSSGRLSLSLAWLLAATQRFASPVAFIDACDALDPSSVSPALRARLLWIRAKSDLDAMRCLEHLLEGEGFAMACCYLVDQPQSKRASNERAVRAGHWLRVQRRAEQAQCTVLAVTDRHDLRAPASLGQATFATRAEPARWGRSAVLDQRPITVTLARSRTSSGWSPPAPVTLHAP
ncbi:MAG: hypothetical protein Q8Q09_13125 [Deltaproteobacteria bacterium]|nr:hypothetical protein [Deltaproteobacteria bacterium]